MHELCHRCGGELSAGRDVVPFCPHCGAPQLYLQEQDRTEPAEESNSTGELPPPFPQDVDWKTAIRCAVLIAGVAALLSLLTTKIPALSVFTMLWIVSGSMTTLSLYQRRRPLARMDAGVGARIGVVTGVVQIGFVTFAMAVAGLVARFGLHAMGGMDADMTQQVMLFRDRMVATNPTVPPELLRLIDTAEFRAGLMLGSVAMMAGLVLVLSTVGGAVGGLMRTRRRTAA